MSELAKNGNEKVMEVAGEVYHDTYAEGGDRTSSTRIRNLGELRNIPWLDDETAEKIYNDYLAPKGGGPISGTTTRI